jgi:hypothetical protein
MLGAGAHDASYAQLQSKQRLRFMQQLLHTPPLFEGPYCD